MSTIFQKFIKESNGITLVEIILSVGMIALLILGVARFVSVTTSFQSVLVQQLQSQQDTEGLTRLIVTEIRTMGQSSIGAYPIESASTSSIVFFSDIDRDGYFDRVNYYFGTSTIAKSVTKPTGSPLSYVTSTAIITTAVSNVLVGSSTFRFYDANYTGTQSALTSTIDVSPIRVIELNFIATISSGSSTKPTTINNVITPRALRTN